MNKELLKKNNCDTDKCSKMIFRGQHICTGAFKLDNVKIMCPCACHADVEPNKLKSTSSSQLLKKIKTYLKLKEKTSKAYKDIGKTKQEIYKAIKRFNLK